jgi:hypothetical protein
LPLLEKSPLLVEVLVFLQCFTKQLKGVRMPEKLPLTPSNYREPQPEPDRSMLEALPDSSLYLNDMRYRVLALPVGQTNASTLMQTDFAAILQTVDCVADTYATGVRSQAKNTLERLRRPLHFKCDPCAQVQAPKNLKKVLHRSPSMVASANAQVAAAVAMFPRQMQSVALDQIQTLTDLEVAVEQRLTDEGRGE